jgi:L-rhamnose-H+ transport protein
MEPHPFLGVFLHALGGLMSATFYVPYRGVKRWQWESYWLAGGVFSWLIAPWVLAALTAPDVFQVLAAAPRSCLAWTFFFGALWGLGGLTFGLTMRYLGLSLGNAIALGFCAVFGTLMPPIFSGEFDQIAHSYAGQIVLAGVAICLGGIVGSGLAGISKEHELPAEGKSASIREFNLVKGSLVAVFCGVMSASMSYGIAAGKPIAQLAIEHGTRPLWQNTPVFVVILAGGFVTNLVWCAVLHARNRSLGDYVDRASPLAANYALVALAGTIWYLQFMFYGMGTTQMGKYDFSSWTLHMASIMIFGTVWGAALGEWRGTSRRTHALIGLGLATLVASTIVVGYGNHLSVKSTPATDALDVP